jgi:hypothetical protein
MENSSALRTKQRAELLLQFEFSNFPQFLLAREDNF